MRVLVADDNESSRLIMRKQLQAWDYDVVECDNGRDALACLHAPDAPSLAVLNRVMPGLDGLEVCRRLRADRIPVYVILLTDHSHSDDVVWALSAGADDQISKESSPSERRARIHAGARVAALQIQVARQLDQLRLQHERLDMLVKASPLSIVAYDRDGTVQMWNAAAERTFGWTESEVLGRPNPVVPADRQQESALFRTSALAGDHITGVQVRRQTKDGRLIDVSLSTAATRDVRGVVTGVMAIFQDITAEKNAERELLDAHEEAERLLSAIASILIGLAADGTITRWNGAARRMFGLRASDVIGQTLRDTGIRWNHDTIEEYLASSRHQRAPLHLHDFPCVRDDGKERVLDLVITPVRAGRQEGGAVLLATDVTEHRLLQSQLGQAQRLEAIGQLAAGLAHEINTPMQYLSSNAGFLHEHWPALRDVLEQAGAVYAARGSEHAGARDHDAGIDALCRAVARSDLSYLMAEIPAALDQSLDGVERVASLVRAMKAFSHPGRTDRDAVDINQAIESAIVVARHQWKYVSEVQTDFEPGLPLVSCLPAEINQVLLNLLINATHAMEDAGANPSAKGRITIRTGLEPQCVHISIQDTGTGIPVAVRGRIFDPFFTTKDVGRGTGQGLALAHHVIVQQHGGRIWFETEEGKGTTFHVHLPLGSDVPVSKSEEESPDVDTCPVRR